MRSGTAFFMLQSIVENHKLVDKTKLESDYNDLETLTKVEVQDVTNIIRNLDPYHAATKEFSGESNLIMYIHLYSNMRNFWTHAEEAIISLW